MATTQNVGSRQGISESDAATLFKETSVSITTDGKRYVGAATANIC